MINPVLLEHLPQLLEGDGLGVGVGLSLLRGVILPQELTSSLHHRLGIFLGVPGDLPPVGLVGGKPHLQQHAGRDGIPVDLIIVLRAIHMAPVDSLGPVGGCLLYTSRCV